MALLGMLQDVANEVGIPAPTAIIGSADQQAKQLLAIANAEGKMLARRHPKGWNKLQIEATHTATAATNQGALTTIAGSDFDYIINDTIWNRTTNDRLNGPMSPALWQRNQAISVVSPFPDFRIQGGNLHLASAPTAGDTLAWEYVSKNWCEDTSQTGQSVWADDTDVGILDEDLMRLGIVWRWHMRNGLDYEEDFNIYEREISAAIGRDGGKRRHSLDPPSQSFRPSIGVEEGSWSV